MAKVGKELGIFTAGTKEHHNGCTVMYGAEGMIWSKPVYFAFIKPERYTWEFVKESDYFTVSYFPDEWNGIHKVYGYQSGRDIDKAKEAGITTEFLEHGIGYKEAREIYICRILYIEQLKKELEPADVAAKYDDPNDMIYGECHYMIIGEITDHIIR
ncbi:MAG: flavin reductase [Anaerovoracaceae bacterium]|jgi:flavin reductase (DIM6/NTAB) family NADH-FMN oxidoreductase RutF